MVMFKRFIPVLTLCLMAATAAQAQGGGGGGRRGGGGGGGKRPSSSDPSTPAASTPGRAPAPVGKTQIVGVIKAIDPATDRVTIAYEANDALNWPEGSNTFVASKHELLKDVTVGEKVRFTLDSQQISTLQPSPNPADQ
jgi:Cu/Ag efflux protein CusF